MTDTPFDIEDELTSLLRYPRSEGVDAAAAIRSEFTRLTSLCDTWRSAHASQSEEVERRSAALDAARKDSERLDWLSSHSMSCGIALHRIASTAHSPRTLRDAIDAARLTQFADARAALSCELLAEEGLTVYTPDAAALAELRDAVRSFLAMEAESWAITNSEVLRDYTDRHRTALSALRALVSEPTTP